MQFRGAFGYSSEMVAICSVLARHATTYHRIQEIWCSVEMTERQVRHLEHREEMLERRIRALADELTKEIRANNPDINFGEIEVLFSGDPRGSTVKLKMPDGFTYLHDAWDKSGVCVLSD